MPAALKIKLTEEEELELIKLKKDLKTPERTRERIEALRLNAVMLESRTDSRLS